jgi:HEAT repeat protein
LIPNKRKIFQEKINMSFFENLRMGRPLAFAVVSLVLMIAVFTTEPVLAQDEPTQLTLEEEAAQHLATLQSDADLHEKAVACIRLASIGGPDAVPVLAELLDDDQLAHYARFGLESNPDSSVDLTFREALDRLEGPHLVGVINSIGQRGDLDATNALTSLVVNEDPEIATAAAAALGRIPGVDFAITLEAVLETAGPDRRLRFADACLGAAEGLVECSLSHKSVVLYEWLLESDLPPFIHAAALRGILLIEGEGATPRFVENLQSDNIELYYTSLAVTRLVPGELLTAALVDLLADIPADRRANLLTAIADRTDPSTEPVLREVAASGPFDDRIAAIKGLALVGNQNSTEVLLDSLVEEDPKISAAAFGVLEVLPGSEVDDAILAWADQCDQDDLPLAIALIGSRRVTSAAVWILEAIDAGDAIVRIAAIEALGRILDPSDLSVLVEKALSSGPEEEVAAAIGALNAACLRAEDRDACSAALSESIADADLAGKTMLFELLGTIGGEQALSTIVNAAKVGSPEVQDVATRVLGEWVGTDVAPALLDLSSSLQDNRFRIRSLRGYIRIARQFDLTTEERIDMCEEAFAVSTRDDERKLILEVLGRNGTSRSFALALPYLDEPTLQEDAAAAIVAMAENLIPTDGPAVKAALERVVEITTDAERKTMARQILRRFE